MHAITFSGIMVDLDNPTESMIDPFDIAHSLSNTCRFNGHTLKFYSVAQHSVLVAKALPNELALAGLLHDSAEAYLGDLISPIKHHTGIGVLYSAFERCWGDVIARKYGLPFRVFESDPVKHADMRALATEQRDLFFTHPDWPPVAEPFHDTITPLAPCMARDQFIDMFNSLVQ